MKAMIFAAGLGIKYLRRFGISDVIINVHHFADMIEDLLAASGGWGSTITVSDERDLILETGGGLQKAAWYFDNDPAFVVLNVDVITDFDLNKLIRSHAANNAVATLAVMKRESSRYLLFDNQLSLCGWKNNKTGEERMAKYADELHPYAFSGIQVVSHKIWDGCPLEGKFSLIDLYLHAAKDQLVRGYDHSGDIFIDVGKPDSLEKAGRLFNGHGNGWS